MNYDMIKEYYKKAIIYDEELQTMKRSCLRVMSRIGYTDILQSRCQILLEKIMGYLNESRLWIRDLEESIGMYYDSNDDMETLEKKLADVEQRIEAKNLLIMSIEKSLEKMKPIQKTEDEIISDLEERLDKYHSDALTVVAMFSKTIGKENSLYHF